MRMEYFTLKSGLRLPKIGFGTYKVDEGDGVGLLLDAIRAGYRYFDTASFYGTETALGEAIRQSGLPRGDFQIASKLWKDEMGYEGAKAAFARSLERLGTDYLDLYLIHWPRPDLTCDWRALDAETWRALEELHRDGRVRAIGVSNFLPQHLENLAARCETAPMVNQLEFHPGYPQESAAAYCREHGVLVQAWSPLGRARALGVGTLQRLAGKYGVSPAQVSLRFAVQQGVMPLPKASTPARMAENLDVFGFTLSSEEVREIYAMPQTGWSGEHPDRERVPPQ